MTYSAGDYGQNPHADINPNDDHGWGGYQWPGGVPSDLLGTASHNGVTATVRQELSGLFSLAFAIAEAHGYTINTYVGGVNWGPWGYENRVISGTSIASNHSKGKAVDWNAPNNPYVNGFDAIQSDFPPPMVADLLSIGLYWGGYYGDAMHWEYCYTPADVAGHVAAAQRILTGSSPTPPTPVVEWDVLSFVLGAA